MYPYPLWGELDLYLLCSLLGVVGCFFLFRFLSIRRGLSAALTNLSLAAGMVGIVGGYGVGVLVQAFFNYLASGFFSLAADTGATFYGGLLGGVLFFFLIYCGTGHFLFPDRAHVTALSDVLALAAAAIPLAHAFGRLGCFFAGCCHGFVTDGPLGVYMPALGVSVFPVQLVEAVYLAGLSLFLGIRAARGKKDGMALYLVLYGAFRFFIEYLRADDRGGLPGWSLSPSGLLSLLLVALGSYLLLRGDRRRGENA